MNKVSRLLVAALLVLSTVAVASIATAPLSGCSVLHPTRTNDTDRLSDLEGDYNLAMEVILYAGTRGWIPRATEEQIEVVRKTANDAIDKLKADVASGVKLDQSSYYAIFRDSLTKLLQYQREYESKVSADKKAKKAATRSSARGYSYGVSYG